MFNNRITRRIDFVQLDWDTFTQFVGGVVTIYHLLYVFTDFAFRSNLHRNAHLLLVFTYVLVATATSDASKRWKRYLWYGFTAIMLAATVLSTGYVFINYNDLARLAGSIRTLDTIIGTILILIAIETTRRVYGWSLVILTFLALVYGLFGQYFPGILNHSGIQYEFLIYQLTISFSGLYGFLIGLSATFIAIFMIFGGMFKELGGADFFEQFSKSIGGGFRSGPAQVAIISSGFMGMLTGAAAANVGATGSYSIPLMKRLGYDAEYAGAVEATASTGGQITPPVMGAAAFIMANIVPGITYVDVIVAAAIPALIFYVTLMSAAEFRARKIGLSPLPDEEQVPAIETLKIAYRFLPIVAIIYALSTGWSTLAAAGWGVAGALVVFLFDMGKRILNADDSRAEFQEHVEMLWRAFAEGGRMAAEIGVALATIAVVIRVLRVSGLLQTLSIELIALAGGSAALLLVLVALLSILFGFSVTTTAAYTIVALLTAPVMIEFGYPGLSAHMFVFYYAILSSISPPVAAAALVASGIAGSDFMRTALRSLQLAVAVYLLPVMWIIYPQLLLVGDVTLFGVGTVVLKVALVMVSLASIFERYCFERYTHITWPLMIVATVALAMPSTLISLTGGIVIVAILGRQYMSANGQSVGTLLPS